MRIVEYLRISCSETSYYEHIKTIEPVAVIKTNIIISSLLQRLLSICALTAASLAVLKENEGGINSADDIEPAVSIEKQFYITNE